MAREVRGGKEEDVRGKRGREGVVNGGGSGESRRKLRRGRAGLDEEKDDGRCRPGKGREG